MKMEIVRLCGNNLQMGKVREETEAIADQTLSAPNYDGTMMSESCFN